MNFIGLIDQYNGATVILVFLLTLAVMTLAVTVHGAPARGRGGTWEPAPLTSIRIDYSAGACAGVPSPPPSPPSS